MVIEFKLHVYGKRQTSDSSSEFLKIENKQIKKFKTILTDKKFRETTNLCVEIMNSKRQVNGETWSCSTNLCLPFVVNVMLDLSIVPGSRCEVLK